MNLYKKLLEVRKGVDYLQRSSEGEKFSYVSSGDVLSSVRDKLNEMGIILEPHVVDKKVSIAEKTGRIFTQLDMMFVWVNVDQPEEKVEVPFYSQGVDFQERGVGKALTYAEKYFILKYFNIPTDEVDPDAYQREKLDNKMITTAQANEIYRYCEKLATLRGTTKDSFVMEIKRRFSVASIETIPVSKFKEIRNLMKDWIVQAERKEEKRKKEREVLKKQQQEQKEKEEQAKQQKEEQEKPKKVQQEKHTKKDQHKQKTSSQPQNPPSGGQQSHIQPQTETEQTPSTTTTETPKNENESQQNETSKLEELKEQGYVEMTVKDVKIIPHKGGQFIGVNKDLGQVGPITVFNLEEINFIDELPENTPILVKCEKQIRKTSSGKELELLVLNDFKPKK